MNLTDYVIEWIFDSTAGKDPTREILVSLNEPFGSYLFSLTSFRKQAFFGASVK